MLQHLNHIHNIYQKSIKIKCDNFKEYAILTIQQILKSVDFTVIFYIPKLQKTLTITLNRNTIHHLN